MNALKALIDIVAVTLLVGVTLDFVLWLCR